VASIYFLFFAGCAAYSPNQPATTAPSDPETVLITYHVVPAKEQQLRNVLADI